MRFRENRSEHCTRRCSSTVCCSGSLNAGLRTPTVNMVRTSSIVFVVVCGWIIADRTTAAPQQSLQPLSAQFNPAVAGYAAGYGYGGAQQVPVAAVGKSVTVAHYADGYGLPAAGYGLPAAGYGLPAVGYGPPAVGYAPSTVYKPDLSAYAASSFPQVEQLRRFNPVVRPVHTVVPKVTAVEPSVTVHKTYVDVPVPVPVPVHHEYGPTVVVQDPYYNYYQVVDRK